MSEQVTFQEVVPERVYVTRCKDCLLFTRSDVVPYMDGYCQKWNYHTVKENMFCSESVRREDNG